MLLLKFFLNCRINLADSNGSNKTVLVYRIGIVFSSNSQQNVTGLECLPQYLISHYNNRLVVKTFLECYRFFVLDLPTVINIRQYTKFIILFTSGIKLKTYES